MKFSQYLKEQAENEHNWRLLDTPVAKKNAKLISSGGNANRDILKKNGETFIRWMRNREGGQKLGNQQVVFKITPESWEEYIVPANKQGSYPQFDMPYDDFIGLLSSKHGDIDFYTFVYKEANSNEWRTPVKGQDTPYAFNDETIDSILFIDVPFALQVASLGDSDSKTWATIADSDVYTISPVTWPNLFPKRVGPELQQTILNYYPDIEPWVSMKNDVRGLQ